MKKNNSTGVGTSIFRIIRDTSKIQLLLLITTCIFCVLWLNATFGSSSSIQSLTKRLDDTQGLLSEKELFIKKQLQTIQEREEQVAKITKLHHKEQDEHSKLQQELKSQEEEKEKEEIRLTEAQQKAVYEKFLMEHPNVQSMELALTDIIDKRPALMSKKGFWTRMNILECVMKTKTTEVPRYEGSGEYYYKEGKKMCGKPSFYPFRREQILAKLLFCIGAHRGIEIILDTWIRYGGASYLLAAGLLSARKSKAYVTGYQTDLEMDRSTQKRLENYPVRSVLGRTLKPYTYSSKGGEPQGNLYNLCHKKRVIIDAAYIDGVGSKFTAVNGDEQDGGEYYVIRDYCRPKLIILFDTDASHVKRFLANTMDKTKDWEIIIEGVTSGMGCHPENKEAKKFAVIWNKKASLYDKEEPAAAGDAEDDNDTAAGNVEEGDKKQQPPPTQQQQQKKKQDDVKN
jgi:hypothetical protein